MAFILDASATLSWAFADERGSSAFRAAKLLETGAEMALVPDLWWFEVRNILLMGERRGRISAAETESFLHQLSKLRIQLDAVRDENLLLDVARRHKLTVYDAAYLALAMRERIPLATLDKRLEAAAAAEGIALLA